MTLVSYQQNSHCEHEVCTIYVLRGATHPSLSFLYSLPLNVDYQTEYLDRSNQPTLPKTQ